MSFQPQSFKAAVSFHKDFPFVTLFLLSGGIGITVFLGSSLGKLELGMHLVWVTGVYLYGMQYMYIRLRECGSWSLLCIVTVIEEGMVARTSPTTIGVDSPGVMHCEGSCGSEGRKCVGSGRETRFEICRARS